MSAAEARAHWEAGRGCPAHLHLRSGSCHDCAMLQPEPRCGGCQCAIAAPGDGFGKSLGCYRCDGEFCSDGCLASHELETGHGEHNDSGSAGGGEL